jgi:hypothetical protein
MHGAGTTGLAESSSLPCATVLRLIRDLLGAPGFLAAVMSRSFYSLVASVGATGPHDFTVRDSSARRARRRSHRIPLPTSVTIAIRPTVEAGCREEDMIPKNGRGIFFALHLDSKGRIEIACKICSSARAFADVFGAAAELCKTKSRTSFGRRVGSVTVFETIRKSSASQGAPQLSPSIKPSFAADGVRIACSAAFRT